MGGRHARNKGASYEREIAIALRGRGLDPTAHRNVAECQQASVDIITKLPLAIQCKCYGTWRGLSPHGVWNQANEGKLKPDHIPVGIVKITRKSPDLVILSLDDFLNMLEKIYGKTQDNSSSDAQRRSRFGLSETVATPDEAA